MKQSDIQNKFRKKFLNQGVKMTAPETVFFSNDTKIGKNVTIEPYVVFGSKVKIKNNVKILAFSDLWFSNFKNKKNRIILSYNWKLRSLTNYIQQLEMESLGKQASKTSEFQKTGQIIFGGYGPTAQHSYFQLLHQGTQNICADIIVSSNGMYDIMSIYNELDKYLFRNPKYSKKSITIL